MKLFNCFLLLLLPIVFYNCGSKDVDQKSFYFQLKKNGQWVNYPRGLVAAESDNGYGILGGLSCFNSDSTEQLSIQFNATRIKYGADSAAIKPYTKFDFRGVYYVKNGTWIVSCGIGDRTGNACIINELKITEQTETTLTGYFAGNLIPADNSFTITEGKFRLPRKFFN